MPLPPSPEEWAAGPWLEVRSGDWVPVGFEQARGDAAVLRTIQDVLGALREPTGEQERRPEGQPSGMETVGLLKRRSVHGEAPIHLETEAKCSEADKDGVEHDLARVQVRFVDPQPDPVVTRRIVALVNVALAAIWRGIGRSERQCRDYCSGRVRPPAAGLPLAEDERIQSPALTARLSAGRRLISPHACGASFWRRRPRRRSKIGH